MTEASDSPSKMTAREHAALHMKVPQSGTAWLDRMIRAARELDSEQFQTKLQEPAQHTTSEPVEVNSAGQPKRTKRVSKKREDEVVKDLNPDEHWD